MGHLVRIQATSCHVTFANVALKFINGAQKRDHFQMNAKHELTQNWVPKKICIFRGSEMSFPKLCREQFHNSKTSSISY